MAIEVQILLCDAAVADPSGKLHMLGAGWGITSSPTAPHAVAVLVKVPWDRTNQRIPLNLDLLDSDGHPAIVGDDGRATAHSEAVIEVGRPPGIPPGTPIDASFALNVPSLPLQPGRYEYRLRIADQDFHASFLVR
jgi:hypothetical protein